VSIGLKYYSHRFQFPFLKTPGWSTEVDRWYQLDPFAFGLADAYWKFRGELSKPALLFLASPLASNETDLDFAREGGISPNKFVHTLPNIRGSTLCQVMNWTGPVICLQKDPVTLMSAVDEASRWVGSQYPEIWIFSARREKEPNEYEVCLLSLHRERSGQPLYIETVRRGDSPLATQAEAQRKLEPINLQRNEAFFDRRDLDLLDWLSLDPKNVRAQGRGRFQIFDGFSVNRV